MQLILLFTHADDTWQYHSEHHFTRTYKFSVSTALWRQPLSSLQSSAIALVLSRLDYKRGMLVNLQNYLVRHLVSVQKIAARLICNLQHSDRVEDTDVLVGLRHLRIPK